MQERKSLTRREFTVASALAALSGVAITLTACGGGSSSAPTSPSGPSAPPATGGGTADKVGSVSANHGHSAVITAVRLAEGGALSLDITGSANHPHTVQLTADEMTAVAASQRVSKESSNNDAHSHTVTFN